MDRVFMGWALQTIQTPPWQCRIPPSSTRGHGLPLMTRAGGHLAAPIWNRSVKFWAATSRRAVSDRTFARSGSGSDTGRRLGQSYIHMHPGRTCFIDKSRTPSNSTVRLLIRGRGIRIAQGPSSKHVLMSRPPSLATIPTLLLAP